MYRHGDVFLDTTDKIPSAARRLPHCVLAEGEATGHRHEILQEHAAELFEHGNERFLSVICQEASLVHPEHATIALPRGIYRVWFQREYSPKEIRRVVD